MPNPVTSFLFSGRVYTPDMEVSADDDAVRTHPHLFSVASAAAASEKPVETATARPGEARSVKRPAKKAAKKRAAKKTEG